MTLTRTDDTDPELLRLAVLAAGLLLLAAVGGLLWVAVPVAALLVGVGWTWPSLGEAATTLGVLTGWPSTVPPPWSPLAQAPGLYAATAVGLLALGGAVLAAVGVPCWRRWGPTPAGHATRAQIHAELSLEAARSSAERTRPGMSAPERRRSPGADVGIPLHVYLGRPLWASFINLTGTLAPTQSGKSRMDLAHKVIDAPGGLLCLSTKPDLVEFAALARSRRPWAGPVLVCDITGRIRWPAPFAWSPISGCTDQQEAARRAYILVEAAAVRVEAGAPGSSGNDRVFRERATVVLTAYLMAAAVSRQGVDALVRWATAAPDPEEVARNAAERHRRIHFDREPATLLEGAECLEAAANLEAEMAMDPRTSASVWMSVRRVVGAWTDPRVQQLCNPAPGQGLDVARFIRQGGSLFIVADQQQAAEAVPVLTTLAEHWLRTAQDLALDYPARRVEPPTTVVIDELANGTPIPGLAQVVSDAAGRGVIVHWAAQSLAQLERVFGPVGFREVLDNTTSLSIWGGIKDTRTLQWVSELCGTRDRSRRQTHHDGFPGPARHSTGTETTPVMRPGDIRKLRRGRVLLLHRDLPCLIARALDVTRRHDGTHLTADVDTIRNATTIPIDDRGYLRQG